LCGSRPPPARRPARCEEPPPNRWRWHGERRPVTGPSLPPRDARRQARVQRAAVIVTPVPSGAWELTPCRCCGSTITTRRSRGPQAPAPGPDPGGSGRSPAAPIAATGAIVAVTDHERQCRRTASELAILRHSPAVNLQRVFGDMGAFDPSAHALFLTVGHSRPGRGGNGMAGRPAVVGGSRSSGGRRHRVKNGRR